jgi:multidrug efflux pump subunit AcrA (membrane-fusion protein)
VKSKRLVLIALGLIAGSIVLFFLQKSLTNEVQAAQVTRGTAIDAVPAIVNVRSDYAMTLSSEEGGRVAQSELTLGNRVSAGDLILTIDPTDLEIDARILRADIENLEARLALKSAEEAELKKRLEDLENYRRQFASGNYPKLKMERTEREFAVFQESQKLKELSDAQALQTMKSALSKLERRIEKTQIYAPVDGIVTEIFAYPGELVSAGASLATLFSKATVVEAKVNEENFAGISEGLEATVRLLTYGSQLYTAKVSRVLPTADKENQQYTVFLDVEIEDEKLLPGLSGEASIVRRKIPNSLIIPRRSLMGDYVFKAENGKAVFTPVKVGVRGLNNVEIRDGISERDFILTDGIGSLKDGDSIRIAD